MSREFVVVDYGCNVHPKRFYKVAFPFRVYDDGDNRFCSNVLQGPEEKKDAAGNTVVSPRTAKRYCQCGNTHLLVSKPLSALRALQDEAAKKSAIKNGKPPYRKPTGKPVPVVHIPAIAPSPEKK